MTPVSGELVDEQPAPAGAVDALGQVLPYPPYATAAAWRRFARQTVQVPGGCLLWLGRPRDDGYGQFWAGPDTLPAAAAAGISDKARPWKAHRWAYMAQHGPLGADLEVRHRCDEPLCVLAAHLEPGSSADNAADRDSRGRLAHPGRHGLMWWGSADRRAAHGRSMALHEALRHAIEAGAAPGDLPAVVAAVAAGGAGGDELLPLDDEPNQPGQPARPTVSHDSVKPPAPATEPCSCSSSPATTPAPPPIEPDEQPSEQLEEPLQLALFDQPDPATEDVGRRRKER